MIVRDVNAFHDRVSGSHAAASGEVRREEFAGAEAGVHGDGAAPDVLSDVLRWVRLTGSLFFLVDARTPWATRAPRAGVFGAAILPGSRHIVSYHVVVRGSCWAGLEGRQPMRLEEGDILVVPHGDAYFLADPASTPARYSDDAALEFFREMAAGRVPRIVTTDGGGARHTQFLCGFLGCDRQPFNPLLASLPAAMRVARTATHARMRYLIEFALSELRECRPGRRDALLRLSELMFVEALRCHAAEAGTSRPGWLGALHDPLVSAALGRLHVQPARAWTLADLAAEVGSSRSVLAERFGRIVGDPPMKYLSSWRMQLAAGMLSERSARVKAVAARVGYDSEAAFSRAFKKATGVAPRVWREQAR